MNLVVPAKALFEEAQQKKRDLLRPSPTGLCARYYPYSRIKAQDPSTDQTIHAQTDPGCHLSTLQALGARDLKLFQVPALGVLAKLKRAWRQKQKGRDGRNG